MRKRTEHPWEGCVTGACADLPMLGAFSTPYRRVRWAHNRTATQHFKLAKVDSSPCLSSYTLLLVLRPSPPRQNRHPSAPSFASLFFNPHKSPTSKCMRLRLRSCALQTIKSFLLLWLHHHTSSLPPSRSEAHSPLACHP